MRNSKNTVQGISRQALLRLPNYLNYLKKLQSEGVQTVSAPKIAAALGQNEVQVRKDIAFVSSCAGKPKTGFDTTQLVRDLESFLGYDNVNEAVLVGAGQLGRALLNYKGFAEYGVHIVAAFDTDETLTAQTFGTEQRIFPMEKPGNPGPVCTIPSVHADAVSGDHGPHLPADAGAGASREIRGGYPAQNLRRVWGVLFEAGHFRRAGFHFGGSTAGRVR